jgi:UDP-N-acetylmuramate--alanine ligase
MHIYFSGIGGTAIGPLALIAKQAGYQVSGSDKRSSGYIDYLKSQGISNITIGQNTASIAAVHADTPIDWLVYSSAVSIENPDHPELVFAREHGIKATKRDELLNQIISDHDLKLIAIAGTHGKTTTTAMVVWLFKQLAIPISYSVGAKISFGDMGQFEQSSEYFVYECDEFDRNFLAFHPYLSLITGIAYDHHEVFPTEADYQQAYVEFLDQSQQKILWNNDKSNIKLEDDGNVLVLNKSSDEIQKLTLPGIVNRENAFLAVKAVQQLSGQTETNLYNIVNRFPGLSRRFEKIADNIYSDYAHTPEKIAGCLQRAHELSDDIVVVYEPLTNRRQHYIKDAYKTLFTGVKKLYWVHSYQTREDPQQLVLSPAELIRYMDNQQIAEASELNQTLHEKIAAHRQAGDIIVCLSGGGGGSLDEWIRQEFGDK